MTLATDFSASAKHEYMTIISTPTATSSLTTPAERDVISLWDVLDREKTALTKPE